jgi:transposase
LLAPIQNTNSQDNVPEIGQKIAYKANRDSVAERLLDPAVQKSLEVDLTPIDHSDRLLRDMELPILKTAKQHDANTLYLCRAVSGIGAILRLVLLYVIHDIHRFPRVQDFVAYCRLVQRAKASAGKSYGTSGAKIGKAYL